MYYLFCNFYPISYPTQDYDTWHGGFYVNQGKLRFKMSDEADEEVSLMMGTKKRNLGLNSFTDDETVDRDV